MQLQALSRLSSIEIVSLGEPLMILMSSANLTLEKFVSRSCADSVVLSVPFFTWCFRNVLESNLKESVVSGSGCLVGPCF